MTFGLKELSDLRKNFDDTVDIILKREGKGKIEDLSNPHRKFELQFLGSILLKIEEQVKEKVRAEEQVKSHQTIINLTNAYYGAMLTVMQDIENNRSLIESPGLLNDRLKDAIGIGDEVKQEDKPDLYQIAKFHTALNAFLSQIFIGHDSRNGFAKEHMLTVIPTDDLNKLIQTSYKLEKDAQHAIVASFTAEGQIAPEHHKFKANKKSPVSAIHRFGGWDKLNADLDELIKEELADKNVAKIEKLRSRERVAQLHFLNKIRESLEKSLIDEAEKTAVLAGSMHLVRQQIKNGYASSYIGNEDNSVILTGKKKKKGLNQILAIDEVNPQDVEALVTSAIQYIQFMTVEPKNNGKKVIRAAHIFSGIEDFDLKATFNLMIDMIYSCRMDALKMVVEEFKKETKGPEKAAKSYLSSLTTALFFSKAKQDEEDDEEQLEYTNKTGVSTGNGPN